MWRGDNPLWYIMVVLWDYGSVEIAASWYSKNKKPTYPTRPSVCSLPGTTVNQTPKQTIRKYIPFTNGRNVPLARLHERFSPPPP